jgi:short-subunit dehydrogenase
LARAFALEGCRIVIAARDAQELARAQQDLLQRGTEVLAVACDVTNQQQVHSVVAQATQHFGRVDIVVNNAGIIQVGPLSTTTMEDFAQALDVMFWGTLHTTMAVLPQMRARRSGRIVNITSIGGKVSVPHLLPYTCAKFAAVGLSEGLRAELGQDGVQVTTVVPGLMRTGSYVQARFKGQPEREFSWFALGSTLPLISISAERAARQIVRATQRGAAECILSLPANLVGRLHGVCPGTTANLLSLVNRALPGAKGAPTTSTSGKEVQQRLRSPLVHMLTGLGRAAGRRLYQATLAETASSRAASAQRPQPEAAAPPRFNAFASTPPHNQ